MELDNAKQDRSQNVDVFGVEIIPDLAVAVKHAATVDIDILAAELEEGRGVLKDLAKAIGLPVVGVIAKLDVALDSCDEKSGQAISSEADR